MFQSSLGYQVDYHRNGNNLRGNSNKRKILSISYSASFEWQLFIGFNIYMPWKTKYLRNNHLWIQARIFCHIARKRALFGIPFLGSHPWRYWSTRWKSCSHLLYDHRWTKCICQYTNSCKFFGILARFGRVQFPIKRKFRYMSISFFGNPKI